MNHKELLLIVPALFIVFSISHIIDATKCHSEKEYIVANIHLLWSVIQMWIAIIILLSILKNN